MGPLFGGGGAAGGAGEEADDGPAAGGGAGAGGAGGGKDGSIRYLITVSLTPAFFSSAISWAFRSNALAFFRTLSTITSSATFALESCTTWSTVKDPGFSLASCWALRMEMPN